MSSNWEQIKSILGVSSIMSVYGIASLLVWVMGPSGIGERIIIIGLLLMTLPLLVLAKHYRDKRKDQGETAAASPVGLEPAGKQAGSSAPARTYDDLMRNAEEAVQWLRSTKLGSGQAGDAVYRLPWFLVIGPPASGKTSLALSSGLDFRALPSQRHADLNLIRPTRDCEWRVADSAVLLDTSGRYQVEGPDRDEWSALVETLKTYRKDRPLDGLLIVVSTARILSSSESQVEQEAKTLRARLDDVIQRAKLRFPVYLVFTHADSIEGFEDFFSPLNPSERTQVWGTTIPLDQSANAHALFDVEFDYLYDALLRRRLPRISAAASPGEQLQVFDFPLRFQEVRGKLGLFASALFRPNPFSESPLLRGFYFTSSAADGRSGQIRSGNVIPLVSRGGRASRDPASTMSGSPAATSTGATADREGAINKAQVASEGYFMQDLFTEVLLRDKDLAASFQAARQTPNRPRNILAAAAAVLLLFTAVGMIISYVNNARLISDARRLGDVVNKDAQTIGRKDSPSDDEAARKELEHMDQLRVFLEKLDNHDSDWKWLYLNSIHERLGLYSGGPLKDGLRAIYFEAISQRFLKPTIAELEGSLKSFNPATTPAAASGDGNPAQPDAQPAPDNKFGQHYDQLKAYLMLSKYPGKSDPTFLVDQLRDYWKKASPQDAESVALKQLVFYAEQADRDDAPHVKADAELVDTAQGTLRASYPLVNRYYKLITSDISKRVEPVTLEKIIQNDKSVLEGSARVSGSFTLEGYQQMLRALASPEKMGEEVWVTGEKTSPEANQNADVGALKEIYAGQYINEWRKFLNGVKVKEFDEPGQARARMRELAGDDSPLMRVVKEVVRQTNLSASGSSFWSRINPFSGKKSEAGASGKTIAAQVESAFRPVIRFALTEEGKDGDLLARYLTALTQVRDMLNTSSGDQWDQAAKNPSTSIDAKGFQQADNSVKDALAEFEKTAAGIDAKKLLGQPLGNVRTMLTLANREQIEKEWSDTLYPLAHGLEMSYPFTSSNGETSLSDLTNFLNPVNGRLWTFFNDKLAVCFDDVNNQLKPKEGKLKFSEDFVRYINNARRLRQALFQNGGAQPEFTYGLTLQSTAPPNTSIEAGESRVSSPGVTQNFKWPSTSAPKIMVEGQPKETTFAGTWWSVFRMFEQGQPKKIGDNQYSLEWRVGSAVVQAKLQPPSPTNNPFDLDMFKSLRAPLSTK